MTKTASQLQERLLAHIGGGADDFGALAAAVFDFQFTNNPPYRSLCQARGVTPSTLADWRRIPAVPAGAFKDASLACFDTATAVAEFHTSGTTGPQTGRHFFRTLALYDAVVAATFPVKLPVLSLVPDSPRSSLAYMTRAVGGRFLDRLEPVREPVCLIGTAFHFANLIDDGLRFPLPAGSCVIETGGFKGRSRALSRPELYGALEQHLAVPPTRILNEYGMTELTSQFYDQTLARGEPTTRKQPPPWTRVVVIDPQTDQEAPPGQPGLLRILDLANLWSVACLQTEDWGVAYEDGFEILGRALGAKPRGCSLNAEVLRERHG